jgi:hypothetical protein
MLRPGRGSRCAGTMTDALVGGARRSCDGSSGRVSRTCQRAFARSSRRNVLAHADRGKPHPPFQRGSCRYTAPPCSVPHREEGRSEAWCTAILHGGRCRKRCRATRCTSRRHPAHLRSTVTDIANVRRGSRRQRHHHRMHRLASWTPSRIPPVPYTHAKLSRREEVGRALMRKFDEDKVMNIASAAAGRPPRCIKPATSSSRPRR